MHPPHTTPTYSNPPKLRSSTSASCQSSVRTGTASTFLFQTSNLDPGWLCLLPLHPLLLVVAAAWCAQGRGCVRVDGRGLSEVRPISCQAGLLARTVHGSGLFSRGETQSLATATVGHDTEVQPVSVMPLTQGGPVRVTSHTGETSTCDLSHSGDQ